MIGNLVANALNHTPAGGAITLSAAAITEGVRIMVADTGQGIPAEALPHVFDRFWSRKSGGANGDTDGRGSGLGLAIARRLVEAHGGTIEVFSRVGEGTAFVIELPGRDGEGTTG